MILSEYGGNPEQVAESWSPMQIVVMARAIARRRAARMAQAAMLSAMGTAAAFVGGDAAKQFQRVIEGLEREGGLHEGQDGGQVDEATRIAQALGLRQANAPADDRG